MDLKQAGRHLMWCLDVWENEPHIDLDILKAALIATPHIAGYSVQSKLRGITLIYQWLAQRGVIPQKEVAPYPRHSISLPQGPMDWRDTALTIFNPLTLTEQMKNAPINSHFFDQLRKNFNNRHEFDFVDLYN